MPKIDYFIVVLILLVTATFGFLEAVALGFLVAVVLFVVSYSRIDVVRHEWTEATYHSRVTRSRQQRQTLQQVEEQMLILELQGFIFFGTADNLLKRIRRRIEDPEQAQPRFILLDFRRVTGLDSTATLSFTKMQYLAESKAFTLIYAGSSAQVERQLEHGAGGDGQEMVRFFPSLEQGIESCENQILQQAGLDATDSSPTFSAHLAEILPDAEDLSALLPYFEEIKVDAGYCLIRQGYPPQDLYFVQDGQVTAVIGLEGGDPVRLETMSDGVVGEIGFYLGNERTASIVADVPTTLYRLSRESLQRMEKENPQAAANLHRLIAHLLSERVTHLIRTVSTLER
jgi:SulP family sulfate permease